MIRVEYYALFIEELRRFEGLQRRQILDYMRSIERAPFATGPNRVELPPMHRPGTMQANFGELAIRYFVLRDDAEGTTTIVFLRVFRRPDWR